MLLKMLLYCRWHRNVTRSAFIILFPSRETVAAAGGKCLEVEAVILASSFVHFLYFRVHFLILRRPHNFISFTLKFFFLLCRKLLFDIIKKDIKYFDIFSLTINEF